MFLKDADEIETFLDARANDSDSFDFTAPGESLHKNLFGNGLLYTI